MITDQVFHKDLKGWCGSNRGFSRQAVAQTKAVKAEFFDAFCINLELIS